MQTLLFNRILCELAMPHIKHSALPMMYFGGWWLGGCPWLVGWGWSLVWWVRGVALGRCRGFVTFTWRCFASKGPRLPSVWARFSSCFIHFGIGCCGLLSQKRKKKKVMYFGRKNLDHFSRP